MGTVRTTPERFGKPAPSHELAPTRDPCYTIPVANLTITVDAEILRKARIRALEQGTSVSAILTERLARYVGESREQQAATEQLRTLARSASGSPRPKRPRPSRDELHER
jgi:hypothetical protein